MARKGQKVDGWLIVDKPVGMSSARAVAIVKRLYDAAKVGHGGTLDPLASGILPIALGEATKTVSYVMDGRKSYAFRLRFGEARSTDDLEGTVTATSDRRPEDDAIRAALPRFTGRISQVPPAFSAIKVAGRRAYELARADHEVELKPRQVEVFRLELAGRPDPDHADFTVECGKGTYIRSLARDLAQYLGSVGHVAVLRRTRVGPFGEESAISLAELEGVGHIPARFAHLRPVTTALDDIPALAVTEEEARRLKDGQPVPMRRTGIRETLPPAIAAFADRPADPESGPVVRLMAAERLVALARIDGGMVRPVRVLNL